MARTSWLLNRNGRYYLQCRVPSDLIGVIGKKLIKKSLHTADRTEALERLAPEAAEVSELFAVARRKIKTEVEKLTPDLTDSEVLWLVHPDAVEGKDFDVENLKELWKVTLIEDIWIVENNHLGVMSRSYGPGRYADNETYTTDFIKWYMAEVAQG